MHTPQRASRSLALLLACLPFAALSPLACGGSSPAVGGSADGGAEVTDGGADERDGGAADGGSASDAATPEALGRLAVTYLKNNDFNGFYARVVAAREQVRASCPGLSGVDPYFDSGEGSIPAQQGAFTECRSRLNINAVTLADVRVTPQVARLVPPACTRDVPRAAVTVELRTAGGTAFYFTLGDVMTFGSQTRLYGKLKDCGSATTLSDGGAPSPSVTITAAPATAQLGQQVTFTAALSSGTPPYASCQWRFLAGDNTQAGALSGNTCTGVYTYTMAGDFTVSAEVTDSAGRIGQGARTFTVAGGSSGQPDLIIRAQSLQTVNPPAMNQYRRGANLDVQFIAKNIGAGDAPATSVRVYLRDPVSRAETTLGTVPIVALTSGAEQQVRQTFPISATQTPLVYDLVAVIDPSRATMDPNRGNNEITFLWVEVIN